MNMTNIKSEALAQKCSKRRFFLKISSELTGKELCARISFIINVQAECIKPNVYVHIRPGTFIFQWSLWNFLEHFWEHQHFCRTSANSCSCKILFINSWFCNYIISISELFDCFYGCEVHSLLIPFSKESMKVIKVSNLNRYMSHEIRNELDIIIIHTQFSRNLKKLKLKTFF